MDTTNEKATNSVADKDFYSFFAGAEIQWEQEEQEEQPCISESYEDYEYSSNYDDCWDFEDYRSSKWDALTDGMSGDMPDGFDGDYDGLGF